MRYPRFDPRKPLLALALLGFAAGPCFAEEPEIPDQQVSPAHFQTWTGEIDSVHQANADTGVRSEITVKNKEGKRVFLLGPSTQITDKNGKPLQPADLKTGKVTVQYKTRADRTYKAQHIKVL